MKLRALTLRPTVHRTRRFLSVSTPYLIRFLSLGGYAHFVLVNADARYVYISERKFWFFVRSRTIPFDAIARVRYRFHMLPTSFDRTGRVGDSFEAFSVALELKDTSEHVTVARFYGEGSAHDFTSLGTSHGWPNLEGTQEDESRIFVQHLCELTGKNLGFALPRVPDARGQLWRCTKCQRFVPPRPRCLYCGGPAEPDSPRAETD